MLFHLSGFRSYDTQTELYQNYVNQDGKSAADRYSARPGYSEHQTGLAFDLIDKSGNGRKPPGCASRLAGLVCALAAAGGAKLASAPARRWAWAVALKSSAMSMRRAHADGT